MSNRTPIRRLIAIATNVLPGNAIERKLGEAILFDDGTIKINLDELPTNNEIVLMDHYLQVIADIHNGLP